MHILVLHQQFLEEREAGGSRFNQFVKFWASQGNEISVIAGMVHYATGKKPEKYKGKLIKKEKINEKINIYRCYMTENYNKTFLGRTWNYMIFTLVASWCAIFRVKKPHIVIASSPPLTISIPGYLVKATKRISFVFEVRDLWPKFAIDLEVLTNPFVIKMARLLEQFSYKKADIINVLTPAFKEYLAKEKAVPKDKMIYISNAADLQLMKPGPKDNWVREKFEWQDKFVILYIGTHGKANDLDQILETAQLLEDENNILFALIGSGMEKPRLKKKAEKNNITNVQFIDPVPKKKISDFINAADLCTATLDPVFKTTYPNKIFDYMACAKPIILPIKGASRKLVEEANAGIFVPPNKSKSFKKTVLKLKNNPEKMKKMGKSGHQYVKENFVRENLAQKYLDITHKLTPDEKISKNNKKND